MDWDRRTFTAGLAGSAFFTAFAGVSRAQQLEKPSLRLAWATSRISIIFR